MANLLYSLMSQRYNDRRIGEVLELADRRDLGSRALGRAGSNPAFPTITHHESRNHRSTLLHFLLTSIRAKGTETHLVPSHFPFLLASRTQSWYSNISTPGFTEHG
jgi:hypothetical protein